MKRFHLHIAVADLTQSIAFYSQLFGQAPTLEKEDYAKWMLEDPRLNIAISARGHSIGVNHLGFQAEDAAELQQLRERAESAAGEAVLDQGATTCCYAQSDKHWTLDPSGLAWEHFQTMAESQQYGVETPTSATCCVPLVAKADEACCIPSAQPHSTPGNCC